MIPATNKGGSSYEPVPAGTYAARCYSMVHIGTVEETIMGETKRLNKVRITWELPTELKVFKEGSPEQPHVISKEFTLSLHEKATLRRFLESWRGKGFTDKETELFDVSVLIGVPCMLSVIHRTAKNGNTYADISAVSTVPKGMVVPAQINDSFIFNYDPFDEDKFNKLPDFLKDKIRTAKEYQFWQQPNHTQVEASKTFIEDEVTDDLPF